MFTPYGPFNLGYISWYRNVGASCEQTKGPEEPIKAVLK